MQTSRDVAVEMRSGMQYIHLSLQKQLSDTLEQYPHEDELSLNVDGLPLFKSSGNSMWPVLCAVQLQPVKIFPLVLSFGERKPQNLDFLEEVVADLNAVMCNGLLFRGKMIQVKI